MELHDLKNQFSFPEDVVYLNTASFSPAFKSVEEAGTTAVKRKSRPDFYLNSDLFEPLTILRKLFADLIEVDNPNRIATIPSVSYGMANVANNIVLNEGDEILVIEEQFPSNLYIWRKLATKYKASIITIKQPEHNADWNHKILKAITDKTAIVAMAQVHWANGVLFDLKSVREKTRQHDALLIIDGSQSIGAIPFSVKDVQPDALVCAGYKWLFGPYGCAYAYYSDYFDNGTPIEENWTTRLNSENLAGLTDYQDEYKPLSQRYNAGESASFIYVKMQTAALKEVLKIDREDLQNYCHSISKDALEALKQMGFYSDDPKIRAKHLFGIRIPNTINLEELKQALKNNHIVVSYRGDYMRLSCHVFNTKAHFEKLVDVIRSILKDG